MTDSAPPQAAESVDVQQLMAEIRAEVDWKRRAGLYPPDVLEELDVSLGALGGDAIGVALQQLRRSASFSAEVSPASQKGFVASGFKKAVQRSARWYVAAVLEQVEDFAVRAARIIGLLADRVGRVDNDLRQEIADRAAELQLAVEHVGERIDALLAANELGSWRERLALLERSVRELNQRTGIDERRDQGFTTDLVVDYVGFEDRYRGAEEEIRAKQLAYVELFRNVTRPVVDLGCGRGEFLELLKSEGVDAYGVDRHPGMIERCSTKGLDAREGDVLEHLSSVPPGSLGGIFCAQTIEHLDVRDVPVFFEFAAKALAPAGRLVVETINPASLIVFAQAFYLDLGHLRPLHPLMLSFLAERAGFAEVNLRYSSYPPERARPVRIEASDDPALNAVVETVNDNFRRLDDVVFGPQDYAVIATR